jgi:UDP-glucuronate decarboxylase
MHPNDGRVISNFIVQALLGHDITVFGDCRHDRSVTSMISLTA